MFSNPIVIETEVFARIPERWWRKGKRRSILEGPSFDRHGNLYVVNISYGDIFRVSPTGEVDHVFGYDGEPNGLKIHRDGRIFVADHKYGLLTVDLDAARYDVVVDRPRFERFKGLNDLVFNSAGELFFTDQGESDLLDPSGRVWKLAPDGSLKLVVAGVPSPNGLVISADDRFLFLAVTRANAIWRIPMRRDGTLGRVGTFIQLSGGGGPDGMALDEDGGLVIAHAGMGCVWHFDRQGRPIAEIRSCTGELTTNVAFGGSDRRALYITEGDSGTVLVARMATAGLPMYAHS